MKECESDESVMHVPVAVLEAAEHGFGRRIEHPILAS